MITGFVSEIFIKNVRNLNGIRIPISDAHRKHLVITGKNGSGKTSLLNEIQKNIKSEYYGAGQPIEVLKGNVSSWQAVLQTFSPDEVNRSRQNEKKNYEDAIIRTTKEIEERSRVTVKISSDYSIKDLISEGKFLIDFEDFSRKNEQAKVDGPKNLTIKKVYNPDEILSNIFSQFLTNQRMDMLNAREDNFSEEYERKKQWFKAIEDIFKEVFDDENLILQYKSETKVFNILQEKKLAFSISEMSSGYSSYLKIISELLLRMNFISQGNYDINGICFIDEIEAHLHIELQNKALPLLTKFFPNIQFIVTTHSPFVINSLSNSIIFDLENKILIDDPSKYSSDAISKTFLQAQKYSTDVKNKLHRFKQLSNESDQDSVKEELIALVDYFKSVPSYFDPELASIILDIKLKMLLND